jgi:hypothetical protein
MQAIESPEYLLKTTETPSCSSKRKLEESNEQLEKVTKVFDKES